MLMNSLKTSTVRLTIISHYAKPKTKSLRRLTREVSMYVFRPNCTSKQLFAQLPSKFL